MNSVSSFSTERHKTLEPLFLRRLERKLEELHELLMLLPHRTWNLELEKDLEHKTSLFLGQAKILNVATVINLCTQLDKQVKQLRSDENVVAPNTLQHCIQSIEMIKSALCALVTGLPSRSTPQHLLLIANDNVAEANEWMDQFSYFGFDSIILDNLTDLKAAVTALQPSALVIDLHFHELKLSNPETYPLSLPTFLEHTMPIIFISEDGDLSTRLFAVRSGGNAFFCKPLEYNNLVEMLEHLLTPSDQTPFRILIVDDSKTQASFLNATLHKDGMLTKIVNDPLLITEALIEFQPELILLDLYMPGCSGQELASVIRQQGAYLSIPIIFLSAESDLIKQHDAMSLGGDDFLTKPVDPLHLVSTVRTRALRSRALRSQMVRDSLTGLLNRTRLLEQLEVELSRALRHGTSLCFAMLDIDHFKQVNDTYGHPVGDRVIKSLARMLTQRLRKSDIIGRYGGEEFGLILPQTDPAVVLNILNEIRENFGAMPHHHEKTEFHVHLSGGMSFLTLEIRSVDTLCKVADDALYQAKRSGRNKIISQIELTAKTLPPTPS